MSLNLIIDQGHINLLMEQMKNVTLFIQISTTDIFGLFTSINFVVIIINCIHLLYD